MNKVTYDALVKSVAKWRKNVNVRRPENAKLGVHECPLCTLFNSNGKGSTDCLGCPISDSTGQAYCNETPYSEAEMANTAWENSKIHQWRICEERERRKAWREAARKEAEFLAALVPAGGPTE